jgi:hypothetical protein
MGNNYSVKLVDSQDIGGKHGEFISSEKTIYVARSGDTAYMMEVFIHEVFHALLYHSGQDELLSAKQQEALCQMAENLVGCGIIAQNLFNKGARYGRRR